VCVLVSQLRGKVERPLSTSCGLELNVSLSVGADGDIWTVWI